MTDEKADKAIVATLVARRRRVEEILAGDLPTTAERLAGYPPLRGSEADDRRVFVQSLINKKVVAPHLLRLLRQARDDGSIEALMAASDVLENHQEGFQRLTLYGAIAGHAPSIEDVRILVGEARGWGTSVVDHVYRRALARGLSNNRYVRGNVTTIVADGLKELLNEATHLTSFETALRAVHDDNTAVDEDDDAADALARIAKAQDAVEAAAADGRGLIVVPTLDLKTGSTARRETTKAFELIAGKCLELVEPGDLRAAGDQLRARFPHFSSEIDLVLRQRMPFRLLLVGSAGCGKTSFAKALADALKLPTVTYPSGGASDSSFAGTSAQWSSVRASVPLQLIQRSHTANPLIVLDEVEKAGTSRHNGSLFDSLLAFLDPASSRRILDPALEVEVDLSAVSYVATANELLGVPGPLRDRLRVIQMPDPRPEHLKQLVGTALDDLAAERAVDRRWFAPLAEDELDLVRQVWIGGSLRRLRRVVELVADGRDQMMGRA